MMTLSQSMTQRIKSITKKVLSRNSFFAHAENILIAIINDDVKHIRKLRWKRIIKARTQSLLMGKILIFKKSELIFYLERRIRVVIEASTSVVLVQPRDRFIRLRLITMFNILKFESKKDYRTQSIIFPKPSRHSKLEKADILEMTVKHLQAVQRQQLAIAVANDPSVLRQI
ncbi:Protein deadpan [Armadillidium vulgare]|nr:Protein deadpan [Armadillidium vulgare]